jgi:solute carrier family 8 (sodium/calcium exchanger)
MTARYYLAALHFNENSERMQAVTIDGQPRYSIRFPKFKKGEYSIRIEKTPPTYAYTEKIMGKLMHEFETNRKGLQNSANDLMARQPPSLASAYHHPEKEVAAGQHRRRFPNQ